MTTGVVFASTGGNKIVRAVRSFQRMEPNIPVHVTMARDTETYRKLGGYEQQLYDMGVAVKPIESVGFVNGCFNEAIRFMEECGYDAVCLLHDDLIFSPFPEHKFSLSKWFYPVWENVSGLTFAHFEVFTHDIDMRREPQRWDAEDMESETLWRDLMTFDHTHNGKPVYPIQRDWYVRYEGTDKFRPWMRLGPTGFVIPIKLWREFRGFDEQFGVFFDIDYTAECRRRDLPPVFACPNVPWLHLHNQSVNPWADPAPGAWGDTEGAFKRKFGEQLTDFWFADWENRWLKREPFALHRQQTTTP